MIEWTRDRSGVHSLAHVAADTLFVQENPDGSITVRGRLLETLRGNTLKSLWEMQRSAYPGTPEGVVPWKLAGKGVGHTDDEGVCDELHILGFEIIEI